MLRVFNTQPGCAFEVRRSVYRVQHFVMWFACRVYCQPVLNLPCKVPCRVCLGQQLAKINIPTAVAMLLREFHMELAAEVGTQHPLLGYLGCTSILLR